MTDRAKSRGESNAMVRACPACGSAGSRGSARFCSACGQDLNRDYAPADRLMASYHRRRFAAQITASRFEPAAQMISKQDGLTASAFAFVTYSVVPFLGLLFCPFALCLGLCCLLRPTASPQRTDLRRPLMAMGLAVLVTGVQTFLWWALVNVPIGI
jgi:hypothetical protein